MLDQCRNDFELIFALWASEFVVVMGRRTEVLIEPVESLKGAVAEVALVSMTIEGALIGGIGDLSARLSRPFDPTIDRNLWNNTEPVNRLSDLVAGYLVAPRFNMLSNGRRSFEKNLAKRTLISPTPVSR